jgi:hypothetical protein
VLDFSSKSWTDFLTSFTCSFESLLNPLIILGLDFWILWHFNHFHIFGFGFWEVMKFWKSHIGLLFHSSCVSTLSSVNLLGRVHFPVLHGISLMTNLLWKSQSPLSLRGEKADHGNNNNSKTNQIFKYSTKQQLHNQ